LSVRYFAPADVVKVMETAFSHRWRKSLPAGTVAPWRFRIGCLLFFVGSFLSAHAATSAAFDAAPFGLPLSEGNGVLWEDPREIHRVVAHFAGTPPPVEKVRLEYWGSRWPEQRLPKDREPGGADVGWMELGNWYQYDWRSADAEAVVRGKTIEFTFRPVNAKEFPQLKDYPAAFRYTLKLRVVSDSKLPKIEKIEAFTDSILQQRYTRLAWAKAPSRRPEIQVFNGYLKAVGPKGPDSGSYSTMVLNLQVAENPDPNTFDRTLVSVLSRKDIFTFQVDDLAQGPLLLPHLGVAVLSENDGRDYAAVAAEVKSRGEKSLYDRIAELPEQTWSNAWAGIPRKKSDIYFPLGLDGGRQRFRLQPNGGIDFRTNDEFLRRRPGADTPRLDLEGGGGSVSFGLPARPTFRTLQEESLPLVTTVWERDGIPIEQVAFVSMLGGTQADAPPPPGDAFAVWLARFAFTNNTSEAKTVSLPLSFNVGGQSVALRADANGLLWVGDRVRGQFVANVAPAGEPTKLEWNWRLAPGESRALVIKIPYVVLLEPAEAAALRKLDFAAEHQAVAGFWRRRLDQSTRLLTPEPMLNEFYRSHAMHLLVNCEREPASDRRFARVGSFGYGAFANESCMMVVDLDRRGYHQEAQACLDAWLHYQGTVELPGSFASKDGVLYGAGGYEHGGYNQHHGWILWMLSEHYRFTRDAAWLRRSAPGIVKGCDWIIRETARTQERPELERGLLPAGSLEDIGDWWTWLSTSCYTWRGLDSAAWALEQIQHPDAKRIRGAASAYHTALLTNFRKASERSPVVRLRDGTAVPKIPSHVHRRGRSFGWICETLEGALHLLITRAMDVHSPEAEWILKDYEDNLYLSNQYGYRVDDFDQQWFSRGGMSMQACLLLDVEPYLYRDEPKNVLRALFNAQSVSYFPDVRMNTEHAAPYFDDWRGDHFKSSDEANSAGWLRYLFVREEGDMLLIGQAVPREWLRAGQKCGIERTVTYFGNTSVRYEGGQNQITAQFDGPTRNPPKQIRLRFREPNGRPLQAVDLNGRPWTKFNGEWVELPGTIGPVTLVGKLGGL
jgi:hypothetical protein